MNRKFLPFLMLAVMLSASFAFPSVYATGTVYVNPPTTAAMSAGSTFTVQIKVSGIDSFNTWDIMVATDNSVITPTSISITPNIFVNTTSPTIVEAVNCVNGSGTGCDIPSGDGPGVAHSSVGSSTFASGNGLLFTITYQVVGGTGSNIHVFNDFILNGATGMSIPHSTQNGTYGTVVGSPDFSLAIVPNSGSVQNGTSTSAMVNLASLNGFSGPVNLAADVIPVVANGPTATVTPMVTLVSGGSASASLSISTVAATPQGTYSITVTGTGSGTHSDTFVLTVSLTPLKDYSVTVVQTNISAFASYGTTFDAVVASINGFQGTIGISDVVSPPVQDNPVATPTTTSVNLTPGASVMVHFTVTTSALTPAPAPSSSGKYSIIVIGAFGGTSRTDQAVFKVIPSVGLGRGLHYDHKLSATGAEACIQTWTGKLQNNSTETLFGQLVVVLRSGRKFGPVTLRGPLVMMPGGNLTAGIPGPKETTSVSFNVCSFGSVIGRTFTFKARVDYGLSTTGDTTGTIIPNPSLGAPLVGSPTKSGKFVVTP